MSLLGPSWLTFGGSVALAFTLGGAGGLYKGSQHEKRAETVRQAAQVAAAAAAFQKTARATFRLQESRDAENLRTGDRLAAALVQLRDRPARLPSAAAPACAGADGTGLSGPDAAFLVGEAARANRLRADLETCRGWAEAVSEVKP